jgi:hypothetical protein
MDIFVGAVKGSASVGKDFSERLEVKWKSRGDAIAR